MRALAPLALLALALAGCAAPPPPAPPGAPVPATQDAAWLRLADLPTARSEVAGAVLDGKAYVAGGFAPAGSAVVEVYDPSRDTWARTAPMPVALHHTALVALGGKLYALGGYVDLPGARFTPTASAFAYDPRADAWSAIKPLPLPRGAHVGATDGTRIFLAGGVTLVGPSRQLVAPVHVYDPRTDAWSQGADMPTPRDHLAGDLLDGVFYVAGGRALTLETNTGALEAYDTRADAWRALAAMPTPRGGVAGAFLQGRLFVAGGEGPGGTFAEVESYDPRTGAWRSWPGLPHARHGVAVEALGARLHVVGGGEQPGLFTSAWNEALEVR